MAQFITLRFVIHTVLCFSLNRAKLTVLKTPAMLMNAMMIYKTVFDKGEALAEFHKHADTIY